MVNLPPLENKDKLVNWLAGYEILPLTSKCISSDGYERIKKNIEENLKKRRILNASDQEINSKFLDEFNDFNELIQEGCTVESAVTLTRKSKETFFFDKLSTRQQELFIWLMEREWESK
ncbi:hypothetical protein AKJ37_07270 [candidate division MSBL1 archaeon SCGC-AAA259I09]|uniref:Uncharacterized protein n=4 Tax=candidate division MSBL1 TaxID=215777 RepID=A0A133UL32_9EURY|nr:hypothetical protein AKJ66_00615 [candidate division MSBL1 archaeon SCGC-AAA259E22]KXA94826.1 hypothetical protein AKJ37_07270 [candidate division MSBL1 archaeon SCGC-AAA259I09]